ncbi:hypothetical protein GN956_G10379 [Arapaima gigas]
MSLLFSFVFVPLAIAPLGFHAEVVDNFSHCNQFFYKMKEPAGIELVDQNSKKICQKYKNVIRYATLYSPSKRIPLYSAYKFEKHSSEDKTSNKTNKQKNWKIEPQHAIDKDYDYTDFDRGHLYPNSFHHDDDVREATFTLTNAVPMDPCFNRNHWQNYETYTKYILSQSDGTAYIVTGTVPGNKNMPCVDNDTMKSGYINVPQYIWTAVCVTGSFSFAFIGENKEGSKIEGVNINTLNEMLKTHYGKTIQVFADDCQSSSKTSIDYQKNLKLLETDEKKLEIHRMSNKSSRKRKGSGGGNDTKPKKHKQNK